MQEIEQRRQRGGVDSQIHQREREAEEKLREATAREALIKLSLETQQAALQARDQQQ